MWSGLVVGLVFAACANLAVAAVLLFPDDFSRTVQALGIGVAAGSYVGAQLRFVRGLRDWRARVAATGRRQVLWEVRALLERGEHARALEAIAPLAGQATGDLLVAYRLAQAVSGADTAEAARAAWDRVRALDRHGVYKELIRAEEARLEAFVPTPPGR